ncbi:MAG: PilW family protein [Pseudomonadales bacterium]|nr:PilW family protein [Pseudomonadales bacterium]MCP5180044.1 PilW family protein [Pseudomonadales bacterium]
MTSNHIATTNRLDRLPAVTNNSDGAMFLARDGEAGCWSVSASVPAASEPRDGRMRSQRHSRWRSTNSHRRRLNGQQGFSLIELLLALALGLVVTAGIVQLFVGNNQTYTVLQGQSRLQEGARYALDFIAESARAAGYFGCDPDLDKRYTTLNATLENTFQMNILQPVVAFDYVGSGGASMTDWLPSAAVLPRVGAATTTPNPANGIAVSGIEPETDILVLRRIEPGGARIADVVQPTDNPVRVEDNGTVTFAADDYAVISDCTQASVFRVTGVNDVGAEIDLRRDENTGAGSAIFQNRSGASLSEENLAYGTTVNAQGATVSRLETDIYYIAEGAGTNNRGQRPLSLWRKSGSQAPVELVEGIEDLQVWLGIDTTPTDSVNAPTRYTNFAGVVGDDVVRTLRVQITASTVDVVEAGSNAPVTRTFSQTISLRNRG